MRTLVVAALALVAGLMLFERDPGLDTGQILFAIACAVVAAIVYGWVRRRER